MFDSHDGEAVSRASLRQVLDFISGCQGDVAMLSPIYDRLKALAPDLCIPPAPPAIIGLPDIRTLTAMQISVFDNRVKVHRRGSETDFGLQIECWDDGEAPAKKNRLKSLSVKLLTEKEIRHRLKTTRATGLSPDWLGSMSDMVEAKGNQCLYGPVVEMNPGFRYVEGQFVLAPLANGIPTRVEVYQLNGCGVLDVTEFADCYATGKALPKGVMVSARVVFGDADDWSTQACPRL